MLVAMEAGADEVIIEALLFLVGREKIPVNQDTGMSTVAVANGETLMNVLGDM